MQQTYSTKLLRELRQTIGTNIRNARTKERMTLAKLSRMTGVPERALDHYELGKGEITLEELLRVSCVLGI